MLNIPTGPHSDYFRVMGAGIEVFKTSPFLGVGPEHIVNCALISWAYFSVQMR